MSAYPRISVAQFAMILSIAFFGFPALSLSSGRIYEHLGHQAWMVIPVACLFTVLHIWFYLDLAKAAPHKSLPEWSRQWLGKWLGSAYTFIVMIVVFLWGILNYKAFWYMIDFTQLNETPFYLPNFYLIGAVVFLLYDGLESWARASQLLGVLLLFLIFFLQMSGLTNANVSRLLPLTPLPIAEFRFRDIQSTILMFPATFLIFFLYPNLNEHKRVMRRILGALGLAAFLLVLVISIPLMIFGADAVKTMTYPPQEAVATISLEYLPLKKLIFLTPIIWQLLIVFILGVSIYCATKCLQSFLPSKSKKWPLLIVGAGAYVLSVVPVDYPMLIQYYKYWLFTNLAVLVAVPFLIWSMRKVVRRGKPS